MIIAVDFDGTCTEHRYPEIGKDIGAEPVLKRLSASGHQLILWTMRSGKPLKEAVNWFQQRDIPLYGVNCNPSQKKWTDSPKVYAHMYIDDAALGIPLCTPSEGDENDRPYVDWLAVEQLLFHDSRDHEGRLAQAPG